jgi:Kef-type K+ transport system membrane component KefB
MPRVTALLIVGLAAGPSVFDIVPHEVSVWFREIAHIALAMVAFLLGESFIGREFKESKRAVLYVSIGAALGAALAVFIILLLARVELSLALLLAGIATSTAPAAIYDVIHQNHARGPLSKTVVRVVAIDDAWGVIVFSLLLVTAETLVGHGNPLMGLFRGLWDVFGAILLGIIIGLPMAWLTGRLRPGEPTLLEASGFVLLCGGLSLLLDVSYLLSCIMLGATVANQAKHHTRPFREIEGASEPFIVIFFLLAGYNLHLETLKSLGLLGAAYVFARALGKVVGGNVSARLAGAPPVVQSRVGWCLLPQAGVAIGLALLATERIPELGNIVLPTVIASTVIFELAGPILARWHLHKAKEL